MQLHRCSVRTQFPLGTCSSGRCIQKSKICLGTGQRARFQVYHRPAALGEEQGDDGHRDMPQPDASKVDDTLPYLFKLLSVSVVGGAVIKYGSLFISLPFHPNGFIAVSIIAFPPVCFAVWMLAQPRKQS